MLVLFAFATSFNSSLVRLGAGWQPEYSGLVCEFQFQLGAIGSTSRWMGLTSTNTVSIPAWCDWEYRSA